MTLYENPDPVAVLYRCNVTDEDTNDLHRFYISGANHSTNGTGFQVFNTTGVMTRGPWIYWEDGKERSPLSYEDGTFCELKWLQPAFVLVSLVCSKGRAVGRLQGAMGRWPGVHVASSHGWCWLQGIQSLTVVPG